MMISSLHHYHHKHNHNHNHKQEEDNNIGANITRS